MKKFISVFSFVFILMGIVFCNSSVLASTTSEISGYNWSADQLKLTSSYGSLNAKYAIFNQGVYQTGTFTGNNFVIGTGISKYNYDRDYTVYEIPVSVRSNDCSGLTSSECFDIAESVITFHVDPQQDDPTFRNLVVDNDPHAVTPPEGGGTETASSTAEIARDMFGNVYDNIEQAILANLQLMLSAGMLLLLPFLIWEWFNKKNGLWW